MDEYGAAFGFFPQLKPRRNINTDTSSLPLDVFRGRLAGLLGAPSDILNLLSSPKPMEVFGDVDYSPNPQLPYGSEQWLKELPLPPTSQAGNVLGKAASFVPLNPAPVIRGVQKAGQIAGEELAATMLGQRPNSLLDKVVPKPMFAVPPEQGLLTPAPVEPATSLLQTKPQAPVSDIGFYSAAEQAAMNIKRNAGPGQAMLNDILKGENVKADEIKWMGLDDFLRDKKNVTKQEVQDYIAQNRVDVQEVQLGGGADVRAKADIDYAEGRLTRDQYNQILDSSGAPSKFGQYTLPGGENYREILLTMPNTKAAKLDARRAELEAKGSNATEADRQEWASIMNQLQPETRDIEGISRFRGIPDYRSGHWEQPNVLAHIRVNDRVDADGKKMLLIEEVQSDWHQAGREKGYATADINTRLKESEKELEKIGLQIRGLNNRMASLSDFQIDEFNKLADERQKLYDRQGILIDEGNALIDKRNAGVPDAPFKDTWYQLALKRALKYAADNGYERVGLTTGARQAERYDLSKQVDKIVWNEKTGDFAAQRSGGDTGTIKHKNVTKDKLADIIGKEPAKRLIDAQENSGWKSIEGQDLQVGGEGMKKYYDDIYPKFLEKYGKKWGASVGETTINLQKDLEGFMPRKNMQIESVRYIDITPEMRTSTSKGQPLFSAAPLLPTTGLLADEEKRKELKSLLEY